MEVEKCPKKGRKYIVACKGTRTSTYSKLHFLPEHVGERCFRDGIRSQRTFL